MGFLITFNRKMYLTAYINNLQSKITDITAQRLRFSDEITKYTSEIGDIGDTESPAVKKLEARKKELENLDKKLEAELQKYQTQLQASQTELQSADQALQQSIAQSFRYSLGGNG